MPTLEVWVVLDENGNCEVANDEDAALERLKDGLDDVQFGTACRVVKLNVTMSEPRYRDDGDVELDEPVEVTVPDGAGHIIEIETE